MPVQGDQAEKIFGDRKIRVEMFQSRDAKSL
jgi:hypothetical protein